MDDKINKTGHEQFFEQRLKSIDNGVNVTDWIGKIIKEVGKKSMNPFTLRKRRKNFR